jgi:3-hydroxybutyryl-CoA dehydrogenase
MPNHIKTVGIIGEGKMGTNLFYYLLEFPFSLVWICSADADIEKIRTVFTKKTKRLFDAGIINEPKYKLLLGNRMITSDIHAIASCDLIIEAVSENLDLKKRLFKNIHSIVNPDCIITSNSSSFNPSLLVPAASHEDRFAGLHFFYPVSLKNIVELIVTGNTSRVTIGHLQEFLSTIDRNYLLLKEDCSFILNRIFLDFQVEAFRIVNTMNLTFAQADELVREHFSPAGVFGFCDHVGNDIMLTSVKNYTASIDEQHEYQPFIDKLEELVKDNRLGVKSGSGFYSYFREESSDKNSQTGIPPEISLAAIQRLQSEMKISIEKFSSRSQIPALTLNHAMKEYLGTELNLI